VVGRERWGDLISASSGATKPTAQVIPCFSHADTAGTGDAKPSVSDQTFPRDNNQGYRNVGKVCWGVLLLMEGWWGWCPGVQQAAEETEA
jgi:hypothetical protein